MKTFEPSQEDISWQISNWISLPVGGQRITGYGRFIKTEKGYDLIEVKWDLPLPMLKEFIFRATLVCEAADIELNTDIFDEKRTT